MGRFKEFEVPAEAPKPPDAAPSEIRKAFPNATALIDELKAAYPGLFATATTLYMAEAGREVKTHKYRQIEKMKVITMDEWDQMGATSKRNLEFMKKGKR